MAATIVLAETNGPLATATETLDVSNVNMGSDDGANLVPATYPVTAQTDGHSYEKWLRLYMSDLGGSTQIDNVKVWLSALGGGWEAGEGMSASLVTSGYTAPSYLTGGPIETDSADAINAMPETEPGGANVGIGGALAGALTTVPTYTDFFVLQLDVSSLTPAGAVNQKTITFQWDEQ